MIKTDCFAATTKGCKALDRNNCDHCSFYKPKGTECNTCGYNDTERCKECPLKE